MTLSLVKQIGSISLSYNGRSIIDTGLNLTAGQYWPHIDLDNIYQFKYPYYGLSTKLCQREIRENGRFKLQE
jgi:hypothetical protein